MARILGLGDNVCDIYTSLGQMYPGGQALNVAVFSRMLGADSEYMGCFGSDEIAQCVQAVLGSVGVPFPRARSYEGANGYALVELREGDRVFIGSNKGGVARSHPLTPDEADRAYMAGFDLIHTSNNSYFDDALVQLALPETMISYDFSGTWRDDDRLEKLCGHLDYGFVSCSELDEDATLELCRKMRRAGCRVAVATMGARGAWYDDGGEPILQKPDLVEALDTLGAGDSFAAALLTALAPLGRPPKGGFEDRAAVQRALEGAAAFSAKCCLTRGAFGHGKPILPEQIETARAGIIWQR